MGTSAIPEDLTTRQGQLRHRSGPGRRGRSRLRRVPGLVGPALMIVALAVATLAPESLASWGRNLSGRFSEHPTAGAPAPGETQAPADPRPEPQPQPTPRSTEDAMAELARQSPLFGLYTPDSPSDEGELAAAEAAVGTDARIVTYFADATHPLDVSLLDDVAAQGAVPMLSLETTTWSTADIAAGRYDQEIRTQAGKLAEFGHGDGGVVLIRLDHEMNGDWYPWSEAARGNAVGDYAAAWKRIVDVVRNTGTGNTTVLWVWSPNILRGAELRTMIDAYPGDEYVDYIGLTGYGDPTYERTAGQTFDSTARAIRTHISADKPLMITESGAGPGKYRTAWTRSLGPWLEANDDVQAFVWFDVGKSDGASANWSFSRSPVIADALRRSLAEAGATPLKASR